jgi:hypothetical protein
MAPVGLSRSSSSALQASCAHISPWSAMCPRPARTERLTVSPSWRGGRRRVRRRPGGTGGRGSPSAPAPRSSPGWSPRAADSTILNSRLMPSSWVVLAGMIQARSGGRAMPELRRARRTFRALVAAGGQHRGETPARVQQVLGQPARGPLVASVVAIDLLHARDGLAMSRKTSSPSPVGR